MIGGVSRWLGAAVVGVAIGLAPAPVHAGGGDAPPVFSDVSLADAIAQTKDGKKIAVVKFTAEWCGPCKRMDKTTWREEAVVKWVKDNGIAIQVDVDKKPDEAQSQRVQAMPTMVVFVKGEEFDRAVGFMTGDAMSAWLDGVKAGKKRMKEGMARRAGPESKPTPGGKTVRERMDGASTLLTQQQYKEAADEYAWLWQNMLEYQPSMAGVRVSFLASDMKRLAALDAGARGAFVKLRDAADARLQGENKSFDDLSDWIVLNDVVGEQDKTLAWFDKAKNDPQAREQIERQSFRLERLLVEKKRWADLGRLGGDPIAKVETSYESVAQVKKLNADRPSAELEVESALRYFRESTAALYAGLLAAERPNDAEKVAAAILKKDDTGKARVALVRAALDAGQVRKEHLKWLEEAGKAGEAVDALKKDAEAAMKN